MLANVIAQRIKDEGPIGVDVFMDMALLHPQYGYYRRQPAFGKDGDFITSPDISQMFGEMLALWIVDTIQRRSLDTADGLTLVELGGGRGALMADMLRVLHSFKLSPSVIMVEASDRLRTLQRSAIDPYPAQWVADIKDVKTNDDIVFVIANEFLDALPIRQFVANDGVWQERVITLDDAEHFSFTVRPCAQDGLPPPVDGKICEINSAARDVIRRVADMKWHGLFIDYGYDVYPAYGDTLQAMRRHAYSPVFDDIGESDVTAHVDFHALRQTVETHASVYGSVTQGDFLKTLGIVARSENLMARNPDKAQDIASGCHRLIAPQEMGNLFRVMAVMPHGICPAGFEGDLK